MTSGMTYTPAAPRPCDNNTLNNHIIMILVDKKYLGFIGGNDLSDGEKITSSM